MLRKRCQKYNLFGDYIIYARRKYLTQQNPSLCSDCKYLDKETTRCLADDCGQIASYYCLPQLLKYKYQPYDVKEV